jgi:hypothetical protein
VGKTFLLAVWIIVKALQSKATTHPWWWMAPTYNQVVQGFRLVFEMSQSAGVLKSKVGTPYPTINLINGAVIEFRSWEREQNLLGTTIAGGVVDEAGLLGPAAQAIISTRRSETLGPLRYIGNPGLVAGPFRKLCNLGEQARDPGSKWQGIYSLHKWSWKDKHDALEGAARADYATFIEQERESLPGFEFRRLYEAEWTEDEAAVFRGVEECISPVPQLLSGDADQFVVGIDVGQQVDYLAAVSMGVKTRRLELRERFRGIGYPQAAQRLQALQHSLHAPFVVEVNGPGIALVQEFDRLGVSYIPFTTTSQSKQEIILALAGDVQNKRIQVADNPPLPYEMAIFRYSRTPSGLYKYSAPEGEHDDTVMAAALARFGVGHAINPSDYGWIA